MEGALPNLIVIGAMKSGTTSLHDYLNIHPDIQMSEPKELDFFINPEEEERSGQSTFSRGMNWYKLHFDQGFKIRGESSQNYSKTHKFPSSPVMLRKHLQEVKLIYILRDPVERFLSNISEIQYGSAFEGSVKSYEDLDREKLSKDLIVQTGFYAKHIKAYLEHFDKDEIMVLFLEDLLQDRVKTMNEVFEFLGLSRIQDPTRFDFQSNVSSQKFTEGKFLQKVLKNPAGKRVSSILGKGIKGTIKSNPMVQKLIYRSVKKGQMPESLKYKLIEIYAEDVKNLKELIGKSKIPFRNF